MRSFTFVLFLIFIICIDYMEDQDGAKSYFFKDKTEIELLRRENQLLEE